MRITTRFIVHLALGLVLWILASGLSIIIIIEGILPPLGLIVNENTEGMLVGWIFGGSTLVCVGLFGWYFGGPIGFIMNWIYQLSQHNYENPIGLKNIYTRKSKLRMRYLLYKEVLQQLEALASTLQANDRERRKIEQAKQEWIAGISHDLKTPLTYITGYSTLLLNNEYEWSQEEACSFLQEIHDKGIHMEELINDFSLILQLNHADGMLSLNKTALDMVEFTKRVVADISNNPQASSYRLHFKTDTPDMQVDFDPKFMYRILQNILMNSIIHNPEHTDIYTELSSKVDAVVIRITDNGVGMSIEMVDNLFQQYYRGTTTDAASEGTGLGMAIVYKLVQAHKGTISVTSELSKGTSFEIRLPKMAHTI
ncbi:sensor histidine kinase [Paenibacillus agilis]|uniref:histidine kinase n=1 Tax=Paenibacillus agilis TaxID=3020863 RepID=A0A559IHC3_9BACL|nr:HAMP domain-containing sensor histidine kinase [Paenibacillus agilis]TVX87069.1 HAMP domain-containing histidine kinase [Paenibacillus agilis]